MYLSQAANAWSYSLTATWSERDLENKPYFGWETRPWSLSRSGVVFLRQKMSLCKSLYNFDL